MPNSARTRTCQAAIRQHVHRIQQVDALSTPCRSSTRSVMLNPVARTSRFQTHPTTLRSLCTFRYAYTDDTSTFLCYLHQQTLMAEDTARRNTPTRHVTAAASVAAVGLAAAAQLVRIVYSAAVARLRNARQGGARACRRLGAALAQSREPACAQRAQTAPGRRLAHPEAADTAHALPPLRGDGLASKRSAPSAPRQLGAREQVAAFACTRRSHQ